jgi:hypothetical protein
MLTAVLAAQYERQNTAFNRKDIALANARHAVRLTLKINEKKASEIRGGSEERISLAVDDSGRIKCPFINANALQFTRVKWRKSKRIWLMSSLTSLILIEQLGLSFGIKSGNLGDTK